MLFRSYASSKDKPNNFSTRLLESHGFNVADMFTDSSILETFLSRNEQQVYLDKIYNIKNFIYQNIYNNLIYIYRSKGTEKSIRNFLRCYGIDENLIKVNLYSNATTFTLDDRYIYTYAKKKYIDLNHTGIISVRFGDPTDERTNRTLVPEKISTIQKKKKKKVFMCF